MKLLPKFKYIFGIVFPIHLIFCQMTALQLRTVKSQAKIKANGTNQKDMILLTILTVNG